MARQSLDLSCSEDSEGLCTPLYIQPFAAKRQGLNKHSAEATSVFSADLLSENQSVRVDLEVLLLREHEGFKPSNYLIKHDFMTPDIRQQLVAAIISASHCQGFQLPTSTLAVSILDRFSAVEYFKRDTSGFMWLAALASLTLAAKLEEVDVPCTMPVLQAEEPWLGRYNGSDVTQMEMLIMRALGWRPLALTSAAFLDHLLCDALSGVLYQLQFQPEEYLAHVRQFAATLLSHTLSADMHLTYPASTQACAVIVLAFQEHGIDHEALMCLIEEWTQLGIVKILACMHATVSHIDDLRTKYAYSCVPCASEVSTHTALASDSMYSSLPYRSDVTQEASSSHAASPAIDIGSARLLSSFPPACTTSPLETASSLSSTTTFV